MRAIVLVGGEGTRLRPLTFRTPKQLVPILNHALLEYLLAQLREHSVMQVTLAMTRRSDAVREAFRDGSHLGIELSYAYEDTPLGSGGAIASIACAGGWDEPFIVCNGDLITDLNISAFISAHRERGAELSISLHEVDDPSQFGVVQLEDDGRIARFVEKPPREEAPSRLINAGAWLFEPSVLAEMDAENFNRVEDGLFPSMATSGRPIYGYRHDGYWIDVGNPDAYRRANLDLLSGACPDAMPPGWPAEGVMSAGATVDVGASVQAPALLGVGATVHGGGHVVGPAVLGAGCVVERGAEVHSSVLWDGVHVGRGAIVRDSVLASGSLVGPGAVLESVVLGHGASVGDGMRVEAGARIEPGMHYATATAS